MSFMFKSGDGGAARAQQAQEQKVANDRQLAALNTSESNVGLTRRKPRGRRLFADAGKDSLPEKIA